MRAIDVILFFFGLFCIMLSSDCFIKVLVALLSKIEFPDWWDRFTNIEVMLLPICGIIYLALICIREAV